MGQVRAAAPSDRADVLVRQVEATIGQLADPELELPLPTLQRLERALALGHQTNLLRLSAISDRAMGNLQPRLTAHQVDTLRLYEQLGSYRGVADFRGVSVEAVDNTLRLIRVKLGVATTAEALEQMRAAGALA